MSSLFVIFSYILVSFMKICPEQENKIYNKRGMLCSKKLNIKSTHFTLLQINFFQYLKVFVAHLHMHKILILRMDYAWVGKKFIE